MKRLLANPLYKLIAVFALAYIGILLLGNVANLQAGYRSAMDNVSNKVFREFWSKGYVFFEADEDPMGKEMDTSMRMLNREALAEAQRNNTNVYSIKIYCSLRNWGFLSTAFFLALAIAAPVPLRRKLVGAAIGFLLVQLFVLFRIWVDLEFTMQQNPKLNIVDYGGFWEKVIVTMDAFFAKNIVIAFIVPLLIWILVMFKREDMQLLRNLRK